MVALLLEELPSIEALESQDRIVAALSPGMEDEAREDLLDRLSELIDAMRETAKPETVVIEHNPDKAREWFAERGVRVYSSPTNPPTLTA